MPPLLDTHLLILLGFIALFTGFVKTGLPALGALISVSLALLFPPRDALGLAVLYLLAGDVMATTLHWRKADWPMLRKLLPTIFIGLGLGIVVLQFISDAILGTMIGLLIIILVCMEPFRERITQWAMERIHIIRGISGILAGFTTTVGNVAGPVLSLYFLLLKVDKYTFVGTAAFFFLIVNLSKLPLYGMIGIFKTYYLSSYLVTVPFVFLGALLGKRFLEWIPQKQFNQIILIVTGLAGLWLFVRYSF